MAEIDRLHYMPRTNASAMSVQRVSLEKLNKRLLTVLHRDIAHLMIASKARQLSKDESSSLTAYLKLTKILMSDERAELESKSDEELEKIANTYKQEKKA